jgi:hypothetical protein
MRLKTVHFLTFIMSLLRSPFGILILSLSMTREREYLYIAEMRYCEISKEMSSWYFGQAVFCLFEARVPEFDTQTLPSPPCNIHYTLNTASNSGTPEPQFLNISWRLKLQLFAWKDIFLTIPAFSGFLNTQAVFLEGWPALLRSVQ